METTREKFLLAIAVVLLVLLGASIYTGGFNSLLGINPASISEQDARTTIQAVLEKQYNLSSDKYTIDSVSEDQGNFKIGLTLTNDQGQKINQTSYLTPNGKVFFPYGVATEVKVEGQENEAAPTESAEIPQTEKPAVDLYVMSFCPFGNQAEDTLEPVYNLLGDKVDWEMHYIVNNRDGNISSLHGQPEVDQNIREACVLENNGLNKWWDFVTYVNSNCGTSGSCWEEGVTNSGLNKEDITTCFDEKGTELMKANAEASTSAEATGSPTLLINGVKSSSVYQYGKPQVYKEAICQAFTTPPAECDTVLEQLDTGSSGGSCGT